MSMEKRIQAKDLDEAPILDVVRALWIEKGSCSRWAVADTLPLVPPKVVLAKLRAMVKKGLLDGCPCGCRGDFIPVQPCQVAGCQRRAYRVRVLRWQAMTPLGPVTHESPVGLCVDDDDALQRGLTVHFSIGGLS